MSKQCLQCDKEVSGKKTYCNDACRMAYKRAQTEQEAAPEQPQSGQNVRANTSKTNKTPQSTPEIAPQNEQKPHLERNTPAYKNDAATVTASLEHYQANPGQYIPRTNPETLNWGVPMSANELANANLTANRVSIPGDWDYAQPTTQTDDTPTQPDWRTIKAKLPGGVSQPTGTPTAATTAIMIVKYS